MLLSLAPPEPGATRFVDHIVEGTDPDVEIRFFRWKSALRANYDVFHLHWPERLVRRGKLRTVALLTVLKVRRIPIVRTLHNVRPHEPGSALEGLFLRWIDRQTSVFIRLNEFTEVPFGREAITIPHPNYLERVEESGEAAQPGLLLYFGIIRPYKGVDALLHAFDEVKDPSVSLRFVGSAKGNRGDTIRAAQAADRRISSALSYVPDGQLVEEIRRAELVILPYKEMHNSGSVLLALSVARPVLVPKTSANTALAEEVGDGWVFQYEGRLRGEDLERVLSHVRLANRARPNLERRDWRVVGHALSDAYRSAMRRGGTGNSA